jgi:hypothetical protein
MWIKNMCKKYFKKIMVVKRHVSIYSIDPQSIPPSKKIKDDDSEDSVSRSCCPKCDIMIKYDTVENIDLYNCYLWLQECYHDCNEDEFVDNLVEYIFLRITLKKNDNFKVLLLNAIEKIFKEFKDMPFEYKYTSEHIISKGIQPTFIEKPQEPFITQKPKKPRIKKNVKNIEKYNAAFLEYDTLCTRYKQYKEYQIYETKMQKYNSKFENINHIQEKKLDPFFILLELWETRVCYIARGNETIFDTFLYEDDVLKKTTKLLLCKMFEKKMSQFIKESNNIKKYEIKLKSTEETPFHHIIKEISYKNGVYAMPDLDEDKYFYRMHNFYKSVQNITTIIACKNTRIENKLIHFNHYLKIKQDQDIDNISLAKRGFVYIEQIKADMERWSGVDEEDVYNVIQSYYNILR